jgi:hypothetical protein
MMQRFFVGFALFGFIVVGLPAAAIAHCDGMDGPVVKAAQHALADNAIEHVLIWVPASDEPAIRAAFERTRQVRALSSVAREVADVYFFELVVRLHRAAEGAPFTGLRPAGADIGPAIPAADKAIETGSPEALLALLQKAVGEGLHSQLHAVVEKKKFAANDVEAGRAFVKAYVEYVHFVERVYEATKPAAHGHFETER